MWPGAYGVCVCTMDMNVVFLVLLVLTILGFAFRGAREAFYDRDWALFGVWGVSLFIGGPSVVMVLAN